MELDQASTMANHRIGRCRARYEHFRPHRSTYWKADCATGVLLHLACRNLCRVLSGRAGLTETGRQYEPERFLESCVALVPRLDALSGVHLFRLRRHKLPHLHDASAIASRSPVSAGMAWLLGTLDGILFRFLGDPVFGGEFAERLGQSEAPMKERQ